MSETGKGAVADITLFVPERRWESDVNQSCFRSRNTPFHGYSLRGGPRGYDPGGTNCLAGGP